jgi:hypothetical protein
LTQIQWDKLVAFAKGIGYRNPEDAVQNCLVEDLGKHGRVTSYTSWLLVKRVGRKSTMVEVPLWEALDLPTELDTTRIDMNRVIQTMEEHPTVFKPSHMSVFLLRSVGHTYQAIAKIHGVTKVRVKQIETWVIDKLRRYVK